MSNLRNIPITLATDQEHDAVIRALYGSVEKLIAHPNYVSMCEKNAYLILLKGRIQEAIDLARSKSKWWSLTSKLAELIGGIWIKRVNKDIDHLVKATRGQMGMPFGMLVKSIEMDFDAFIKANEAIIRQANKDLGITDDPYVGVAK